MGIERVRDWLSQWGKDSAIKEYTASCANVELAAKAAGIAPARVAKSIAFKNKDNCILVVAAGDGKFDARKFKYTFGVPMRMLSPEATQAFTGYAVGGVCPFAITDSRVSIYCDISLQRFSTVFPACGNSNSAVEMTCKELVVCSQSLGWVDVCAGWEGAESMNSIPSLVLPCSVPA